MGGEGRYRANQTVKKTYILDSVNVAERRQGWR